MPGLQLGELAGLILIQPLWPPQDQPSRPTGGEVAGGRLGHGRQGLPRPPLPRGLALRLAQALGIARHGRVAPRIPTPLELSEESHGVPVPRVPACQEIRVIGREEAAAAIGSALTLGQGLHPEVPKHSILANPQLLGNGPCRPPLLVESPELLMERPPLRLALVRQLLGCARGGGGGTGTATVPSGCATGAWRRAALTASRMWPWAVNTWSR